MANSLVGIDLQILLKGLSAALAGLKNAGKAVEDVAGKVKNLGNIAGGVYAQMTSSLRPWLEMSNPREIDDLTVAFGRLNIQLGRIFVPLLQDATRFVNALADRVRSLTDAQRDTINHWAKIALVVTGAVSIFGRLAGTLTTVGTALRAVSTIGLGPLGLLLGAGAAVAVPALARARGGTGAGGQPAAGGARPVAPAEGQPAGAARSEPQNPLERILAALQPVAAALTESFQRIVQAVEPILPVLVGAIEQIVEALAPIIPMVADAFAALIEALVPIIPPLAEMFGALVQAIAPIVRVLVEVLRPVFEAFGAVIRALMPILRPIIWVLEHILTPVFRFFGDVIRTVGNFFIRIINKIIYAINSILQYIPGTSYIGGSRNYQIAELGEEAPRNQRPAERQQGRQPARPGDHGTSVRNLGAEFSGAVELWKKTMQKPELTPAERLQIERLEQIRDRLPRPAGAGGRPAGPNDSGGPWSDWWERIRNGDWLRP